MAFFIKICGIKDAPTAISAFEAGASAVGLVFADSPRKVGVIQAREIVRALPAELEVIGVFKDFSLDEIRAVLAEVKLDAAQIHCNDGMIPEVDLGVELIPALPADVLHEFDTRGMGQRRYVIDSPSGAGSGRAWDFAKAQATTRGQRMILAGGLRADNVALAIEQSKPWGVDVSSGVEVERGTKCVSLIREFIQVALKASTA